MTRSGSPRAAVTREPALPPRDRPPPILIVGVAQRCGTHYLYDLVVRHPDCRPALARTSWEGSWEDHLLDFADLLDRYAGRVSRINRLNDERTAPLLLAWLGRGLEGFLAGYDPSGDRPGRPVTKSPGAAHLELFPALFPDLRAVLLVRDPRATVASALRTFGDSAEVWIRRWRTGARAFLALLATHPDHAVLVRYEDLVTAPERELRRVFAAAGLDPDRYGYAEIGSLPVRGSSQLGPPRRISWEPVPRPAEFDALGRGRELPPAVAARIGWLAEPELTAFGYAPVLDRRPAGWQRWRDARFLLAARAGRAGAAAHDGWARVRR